MKELILPNIKESNFMRILGFILGILTCLISIFLFWGLFFDRNCYFNKIAFYNWLKDNELPESKFFKFSNDAMWEINGFKLYMWDDGKSWGLHSNKNIEATNINGGLFDYLRNRKIVNAMKKSVKDFQDKNDLQEEKK